MSSKKSIDRHPALQNLSRDHHEALVQAQRLIQGGLKGEIDEDETPPSDPELARNFLTFWEEHASDHFREEEEVLLPVYARHETPTSNKLIRTMLDDHAWFRNVVVKLRRKLEHQTDSSSLRSLLEEIGTRLQDHARMEERELFEYLQQTLSDEDLSDIQIFSDSYRSS